MYQNHCLKWLGAAFEVAVVGRKAKRNLKAHYAGRLKEHKLIPIQNVNTWLDTWVGATVGLGLEARDKGGGSANNLHAMVNHEDLDWPYPIKVEQA